MFAFTRDLIALRKAHPALNSGSWAAVEAAEGVLAFTRTAASETVLCVFNLGDNNARFEHAGLNKTPLFAFGGAAISNGEAALSPNSALIV